MAEYNYPRHMRRIIEQSEEFWQREEISNNPTIENVEHINSKDVQKGDLIEFTVMQDVYYDSNTIPAGTKAFAEVVKANKRKCWGKPGKITLNIRYIQLNNEEIKLQAPPLDKEGISKKGKAWTWFGCTVMFVPLNIIPALCTKGGEAILEAGTTIIAYPHS